MYKNIFDPVTHKNYSITGKKGKRILKKYIQKLELLGGTKKKMKNFKVGKKNGKDIQLVISKILKCIKTEKNIDIQYIIDNCGVNIVKLNKLIKITKKLIQFLETNKRNNKFNFFIELIKNIQNFLANFELKIKDSYNKKRTQLGGMKIKSLIAGLVALSSIINVASAPFDKFTGITKVDDILNFGHHFANRFYKYKINPDPNLESNIHLSRDETIILDDQEFIVLKYIEKGADGSLYKVKDLSGKIFALKFSIKQSREPVEANQMRKINKLVPKSIKIYQNGIYKNQLYILMEYVDGITYSEYREGPISSKSKSKSEVIALFKKRDATCTIINEKICDSLEEYHKQGILHNDLHSGNILIDSDGNPKIIDWSRSDIDKSLAVSPYLKALDGAFYNCEEKDTRSELDNSDEVCLLEKYGVCHQWA